MASFQGNMVDLVVKTIKRTASPDEQQQLEKWAAQSSENRKWLERFYNYDWVVSRIKVLAGADKAGILEEVKRRIRAGC